MLKKTKFSLKEVLAIIDRIVDRESNTQPKTERIIFYKLFNQYPNKDFWMVYSLDFKLKSLAWLLSEDGQERLKTDFLIFTVDLGEQKIYNLEKDKVGEDFPINKKPKTVSDLLKDK